MILCVERVRKMEVVVEDGTDVLFSDSSSMGEFWLECKNKKLCDTEPCKKLLEFLLKADYERHQKYGDVIYARPEQIKLWNGNMNKNKTGTSIIYVNGRKKKLYRTEDKKRLYFKRCGGKTFVEEREQS